jgi:hypothetical protein
MDIAFKGIIGQSVVIYIDDIISYLKQRVDHPKNLKQIFERFKEYDISLNPKKTMFFVSKGIFWGHVISKDGISSGPKKK